MNFVFYSIGFCGVWRQGIDTLTLKLPYVNKSVTSYLPIFVAK